MAPFYTDANQPLHKGLVDRVAPYVYDFVAGSWSEERKNGVIAAFDLWNAANEESGLATRFKRKTAQDVGVDILIYRISLPINSDGTYVIGDFQPSAQQILEDKHITGGTMQFTTETDGLSSGDPGYLKAALREIGHALGLAHLRGEQNGTRGSSVMNKFVGTEASPLPYGATIQVRATTGIFPEM